MAADDLGIGVSQFGSIGIALNLFGNEFWPSEAQGFYSRWRALPISCSVAQDVLVAIVWSTNSLASVWATLGIGPFLHRLPAVFAVSAILGLSLGASASHDELAWWLLVSSSVVTLVPTAIVVGTLLAMRWLGFRLINPKAVEFSSAENPEAVAKPI